MRALGLSLVCGLCVAAEMPAELCAGEAGECDTFLLQTRVQAPPPDSIVDQINDAVDKMHGAVTDAITDHVKNVGEVLKGHADVVTDAVNSHLEDTAEQLQETLANVSTSLASEVITTVNTLAKSVHELTEQTRAGITGLRDVTSEQGVAIGQSVEDAGEAFQALAGTLLESVDGAVSTMTGSMKVLTQNLTGSLGSFSEDLVSPTLQTVGSHVNTKMEQLGVASDHFSEALSQARDSAVVTATSGAQITETLVTVAQDSLNAALERGDGFVQAIQQQLADVLSFLTGNQTSFLKGDAARSSLIVAQRRASSAMAEFRADVRSICDALRGALPRQ